MQLIFCGFKLEAELELQREQEQKNDFILKGAKQAKWKKGRRCPAQFTKRADGSKKNVLQKWQAEPALTWCHIPSHKEANRPDRFAGPGGCIGSRIEHSALCYWFAFVTQTRKIVSPFSGPSGVALPWKNPPRDWSFVSGIPANHRLLLSAPQSWSSSVYTIRYYLQIQFWNLAHI